jgi:hypothetical protein
MQFMRAAADFVIAGYDRRVLCPTAWSRYARSLACCEPANPSALRRDFLLVYRLDGDHARKSGPARRYQPADRAIVEDNLRPMPDCQKKKLSGPYRMLAIHAPFLLLAMLHRPPSSLDCSTESLVVCWPRAESTRPGLPWIRSGASLSEDDGVIY